MGSLLGQVPSLVRPERTTPPAFSIAGTLLLAVGALWFAGTVIAVCVFASTPIKTTGAHDMVPESYSIVFGTFAALLTLPSLPLLALGLALRARVEFAPSIAMIFATCAFMLSTMTVATFGGLDEPGAAVRRSLVLLHASDQITHIGATLRQLGPKALGANSGLQALVSMNTPEGWDEYLTFARSPDAEWRRMAIGPYARADGPLAPNVTDVCLEHLDDPDRETSGYACLALMGKDGRQRYPALYALTRDRPCDRWSNVPGQWDLVRAAVSGRPLPQPPS